MNILFLLRGTGIGGLEVVTSVLANKFVEEGHHVCVFIFRKDPGTSITDRFKQEVKVFQQDDYRVTEAHVSGLHRILVDERIQVIINQWGLPLTPIRVAKKASRGLDVKIISVYHNAPNANGRIQSIDIRLAQTENIIKRCLLKVKRYAFRMVTGRAMRYNYEQSDCFLVLSESYKKVFKAFTHVKDDRKLRSMMNPVTIDTSDFRYDPATKKNEIIYVGRLDFVQKRVYRIIDTWNYLEEKLPDWDLKIVGDGPDRENLENHVKALNLKRVSFEGFKQPKQYYEESKILMLTSDFEGFPLVLAEAMVFGVVPVVYNSFEALEDIVTDGVDGVVIPKQQDGFNAELTAKGIMDIIQEPDKLEKMAHAAIEKSHQLSLDKIYGEWMELFRSLIK